MLQNSRSTLISLAIYALSNILIILQLPPMLYVPYGIYASVLAIIYVREAGSRGFHSKHDISKSNLKIGRLALISIIAACVLIIITHAIPYIRFGHIGFGYDIGYYKRYIDIPFTSLIGQYSYLLGNESVGARIIINVLKALHIPGSFTLFGMSTALGIAAGLGLFYLVRRLAGTPVASLTLVLYALSLVQFESFQLMLWKQQLGMALFIGTLIAYEMRPLLGIPLLGLLAISHRTSFFIASLRAYPLSFNVSS